MLFFFFQAEDGIRDLIVTGVQTCALPIFEARVLNFTAYTNRAMVVHYASIMAAAAYLSWVHFLWAAIDPVLSVLRNVPYAGPVFATLQEIFRGLLVLLDSAVAIMTPLVSAANVVLYTLQEGAWPSVRAPGGGRLARLAAWQVGCPIVRGHIGFQIVSRTELGGPAPPASVSSALSASQAQIYSGQRLQLGIDCGPIDKRYSVFQLATMDQVFASLESGKWSDFRIGESKGGLLGRILGYILRGVLSGITRAAARTRPMPDARLFWLSPYVSFAPQARSRPGGAFGQLGNFAQPDVLVGLVRRASDHDREPGARKYFGRRFGMDMHGAGAGSTDFSLASKSAPALPLLPDGLTAFAAAQVYYHRPGDWREVPNFFNPLWGARLMPIAGSNAANLVPGLLDNSLVRSLLLH